MVIGTVIFAGVALSAFLTLFVIPALYMLMAQKTQSPMAITRRLESLQEEYRPPSLDRGSVMPEGRTVDTGKPLNNFLSKTRVVGKNAVHTHVM